MRIEIENRLIDFSVSINSLVLHLKKGLLSQVLGLQLIRSATSAALNFGEAQAAESRKDFIHKISIVLEELH
jgi:four helix bundle protein